VTAYANQLNQEYEYPTNVVGIVKFDGGAIGRSPPPLMSGVLMPSTSICWARRARSATTYLLLGIFAGRPTGSPSRPSSRQRGCQASSLRWGGQLFCRLDSCISEIKTQACLCHSVCMF